VGYCHDVMTFNIIALKFQKITDDQDINCLQFGKVFTVFTTSLLICNSYPRVESGQVENNIK